MAASARHNGPGLHDSGPTACPGVAKRPPGYSLKFGDRWLGGFGAQVESALAVQKLRPTIDAIRLQYGDDKKSIQRETSALYEESGVNPSAGVHSEAMQ